ncbi:sensor histidine kinase [Actinacidiphila glaucinigra]|uniref:sensor histidine kinase n=1 Tax=Actinacidiphila glaucinigra TaxID=235986 RepID=UPI002E36AFE0|nr:CHASE3 domain-containing protein [Actinacidiphila glaucinigra]
MTAARARLTVQGWIALVLAALGVFMTMAAGVGFTQLRRTAEVSDHLIARISPARVEAYRLQTALVDQETGVRGYAITGDPDFLDPYTRGRAVEEDAARRMRGLVDGLPELVRDLEALRQAAADWRRRYAQQVVDRTEALGGGTPDAATTGRGKEAFDRVRALSATQARRLDAERVAGTRQLADARTLRDRVFGLMVVAFFLTAVALAVLVRVMVVRPLNRLSEAVQDVSGGEYDRRIPSHGPADLHAVGAAVEGMRRRIVTELGESRRKEEQLRHEGELREAQAEELRRSNAELEQFAYVASHDLQEPLRKVASFCQLLEKRYAESLDERGTQYIAFAVDGAKRMQVLINDLLTFSRVGRLNDASVPVALDEPLDRALGNLSVAIEESGAVIERPPALPGVVGDPTLLAMLWQNLVGNAVKFRAEHRPPRVTITLDGPGAAQDLGRPDGDGMLHFSVTDNGIGVPAEFADKIFVIFQRLHSRDSYGGTGIGLALCKKIVEYHGGRIRLDPGRSQGTRIRFTLPAAAERAPAPEEESA